MDLFNRHIGGERKKRERAEERGRERGLNCPTTASSSVVEDSANWTDEEEEGGSERKKEGRTAKVESPTKQINSELLNLLTKQPPKLLT